MPRETVGHCRLCGNYKKLSFEHVPPKSAFNDHQVLFQTMQDMLRGHSFKKFPRGIGSFSLCEDCNTKTGAWYAEAFVSWTRQGFEWLDKVGGSLLSLPFYIRPLNVLKQALVMALAMAPEASIDYHYDLRRFVLNKDQKHLPPRYRVHVYFNLKGQPRFASGMAIMRVDTGTANYVEAEVALPPFGYCITSPVRGVKSLAESQRLYDITWFSAYSYNNWTPIHLRVPVRETHEPFPLDYRSEEEVEEHYRVNHLPPKHGRKPRR